jgi:hypothetical protein
MPSVRIRTGTKGREETIQMLMDATGENTKSKALMAAAEHYLEDKRNKERVIDDLVTNPELVDELSTSELPLALDVSTRVGNDES